MLLRALGVVARVVGPGAAAWLLRLLGILATSLGNDSGRRWLTRRLWHLPGPLASYTVPSARRHGVDFALDLSDNTQRELFVFGSYEPNLTARLLDEARPGDVFLDVGGHVGIHALPMARAVGPAGTVVAVEAAPDSAARLRAHAERNGLDNVVVCEFAVGDEPGRLELRQDPRFGTDAAVRSLYGDGEVVAAVDVVPLDRWWQTDGPARLDLVKLDIEGAELRALRGMAGTLRRLRPRLVVVEIRDYLLERAASDVHELFALLDDLEYEPEPAELDGNRVFRRVAP